MGFKDWLELFEMLKGDSKIPIQWEVYSGNQNRGFFTIDNKIVYGIRKISIIKEKSKLKKDIIYFDFGNFVNGEIQFNLLKKSLYPASVMNYVMTEMKKTIQENPDKIIIFSSKRNNESQDDYDKRTNFYSAILNINARQNDYQTLEFDNLEHEHVFCASKESLNVSKIDLIKVCSNLQDDWLNFSNAKRVLKSLK